MIDLIHQQREYKRRASGTRRAFGTFDRRALEVMVFGATFLGGFYILIHVSGS